MVCHLHPSKAENGTENRRKNFSRRVFKSSVSRDRETRKMRLVDVLLIYKLLFGPNEIFLIHVTAEDT